jgi:hypothetical protein
MLRRWFLRDWLAVALLGPGLAMVRADELPAISIGFYQPVIRDVPRKDVELSLRFWVEELGRPSNIAFKPVRMYANLPDMKRDLADGHINFVVATSMGLAQHFNIEDLADAFSGYKAKNDDLLLLVRGDAGIRSPADLVGKRIALLEGDELTDVYLPTLLMKAGLRGDLSQFSHVAREASTNQQVYKLFFDKVDAALVYRNTYEIALALNPQIGQRLQSLDAFAFKTRSPYIALFSTSVSPAQRQMMLEACLKLGDSVRGRQVLQIYHAEAFERTRVLDLVPYQELLKTYRSLAAKTIVAKKSAR